MFEIVLGSNRVTPQYFAAHSRMKNADWLDVAASRNSQQCNGSGLGIRAMNRRSQPCLHTQENQE